MDHPFDLEDLAGLLRATPDAIIVVDSTFTVVFASALVEAVFGYPPNELVGRAHDVLIPERFRADHRLHMQRFMVDPAPRCMAPRLDTWALRRDGTEIPVEVSLGASTTSRGPVAVAAVREISARKAQSDALRASEERFRTLVEHATDGIFIADAEGHYRDVNTAACQMLGYEREELLRMSIADLVAPDERPRVAVEVARLQSSATVSEWRFLRKDGTELIGEVSGRRLPDARLLAVVRDISERKASEEELRVSKKRLAEAQRLVGMGSWALDLVTQELVWSENCYRLVEVDPAEGASYEKFLGLVHPDDRARVDAAYRASVENHTHYEIEHRLQMPDGRIKYVVERGQTEYDETGRPLRSLGTVLDVSDRRQAEQERKLLELQLHRAQKLDALGTLAGGIAHDFNNILAVMSANLELLALDCAQGDALTCIRAMGQAVERASDLVEQILAFSRQQPLERDVVDVGQVVSDALRMLRPAIPASVEIDVVGATDLPPINADRTQLHQVLINLCTNAWQAMDGASGRIEIGTRLVQLGAGDVAAPLEPGPYVVLSVSDDGEGMDADTVERIFDPFFTTKAPKRGTGLGLAVVHGIVASHGGFITVKSDPGRGTRFDVFFPGVARTMPRPETEPSPPAAGRGERLLVLDDEATILAVLERVLGRWGYQVSSFSVPDQALDAFRDAPDRFDLVLLDFTMPRQDGLEVAAVILERRPELPVMLMSGHVTEELESSAKALGVRRILRKPMRAGELPGIIRAVLDGDTSRASDASEATPTSS